MLTREFVLADPANRMALPLASMPVSYDDPAVQTHDVCPGQDGCFPAYLTGIGAKGTTADAHAEPTALARRPAHRVPSLLHRADVCDLQCHGRRVLGPAGPAHRHRDAGRRGPGRP